MKKIVAIRIEIEGEGPCFTATYKVSDLIFTEYTRTLSNEGLYKGLISVLKQLKDRFTMITISLTSGDEFDLYPTVLHSQRFLRDSTQIIKKSRLFNGKYGEENTDSGWIETNKKYIFNLIDEYVYLGNEHFIELLQNKN